MKKHLLVDTGATHTILLPKMAQELGLLILAQEDVILADGRKIKAGVSLAYAELNGRGGIIRVSIFDADEALLGVSALEDLGLAVDPATGKLHPTRSFVARA